MNTTLAELKALIEANGVHFHSLPIEQDVDVVEDLETLLVRLDASADDLLPAQQQLRA